MDLLERINKIRDQYNVPMIVNSGYRTPAINDATANSGQNSWHLKCAAVDIADADCKLWNWVVQNLQLCKDLGLWMEHKCWTPTWTHFQIYPPGSDHRIFVPSSKAAPAPHIWNGIYDSKYN